MLAQVSYEVATLVGCVGLNEPREAEDASNHEVDDVLYLKEGSTSPEEEGKVLREFYLVHCRGCKSPLPVEYAVHPKALNEQEENEVYDEDGSEDNHVWPLLPALLGQWLVANSVERDDYTHLE